MLGIHEPTEGEVLVGGVRISELGLDALRQMIGTVLQNDVLLAGSSAQHQFLRPRGESGLDRGVRPHGIGSH